MPYSLECLNQTLFESLLSLAAASSAQLIFGLNIHPATGKPSPPQGPWDPSSARFLLAAAKAAGSAIGYVELGESDLQHRLYARVAVGASLPARPLPLRRQSRPKYAAP